MSGRTNQDEFILVKNLNVKPSPPGGKSHQSNIYTPIQDGGIDLRSPAIFYLHIYTGVGFSEMFHTAG
jgi:hypothetical protein